MGFRLINGEWDDHVGQLSYWMERWFILILISLSLFGQAHGFWKVVTFFKFLLGSHLFFMDSHLFHQCHHEALDHFHMLLHGVPPFPFPFPDGGGGVGGFPPFPRGSINGGVGGFMPFPRGGGTRGLPLFPWGGSGGNP